MINFFLISLGIFNTLTFYKDWKKIFLIFIFIFPYLGFIQLKISYYTKIGPLIHDIVFVLPIFIIYLSKKNFPLIPSYLKNFIIIFLIFLTFQLINPFVANNFLVKLVGFKVWILYFFFILIGFSFISNENDIKKFCNFYSYICIIPFIIGIFQFIFSFLYGHIDTLTNFYNDQFLAAISTQNFSHFNLGRLTIYRIPSTFSFVAQYNNFILISFIPIISSIYLSKNKSEKINYIIIFVIALVAAFTNGARGNIFYLPFFFLIFFLINNKFSLSRFINITLLTTLIIFFLYKFFPEFQNLFKLAYNFYLLDYFFNDLINIFVTNIFGYGIGSNTNAARYVGLNYLTHEGYYFKFIYEFGIFGFFLILWMFYLFNKIIFFSILKSKQFKYNIFCKLFYSFFILIIILNFKSGAFLDIYPTNFLFYLYLGFCLRISDNFQS